MLSALMEHIHHQEIDYNTSNNEIDDDDDDDNNNNN
jgi:hypothetical protein